MGDHCVLRGILLPRRGDHCVLRRILAAQDVSAKEGRGREPDGYPIGRMEDHCVLRGTLLKLKLKRKRKRKLKLSLS